MAVVVATTPSSPRVETFARLSSVIFRVSHKGVGRPRAVARPPCLLALAGEAVVQSRPQGQLSLNPVGRTERSRRGRVRHLGCPLELKAPHPTHQRRAAAIGPAPFRYLGRRNGEGRSCSSRASSPRAARHISSDRALGGY